MIDRIHLSSSGHPLMQADVKVSVSIALLSDAHFQWLPVVVIVQACGLCAVEIRTEST